MFSTYVWYVYIYKHLHIYIYTYTHIYIYINIPTTPKDKFNLSTLVKNKFNLIIWNCALRSQIVLILITCCQHFSTITVLNLFWEKLGSYRHALSSKIALWQTVFDIGNPCKDGSNLPVNACSLSVPGSFTDASRVLHGCFTVASRVFHGSLMVQNPFLRSLTQFFESLTHSSHGWFTDVSRVVHGWFTGGSRVVHGWFTGGSRVFHGCFTACFGLLTDPSQAVGSFKRR